MKKLLTLMLLALCMPFVACSDNDDYNADTAISAYEPLPSDEYRMVKSVNISKIEKGREYTFNYSFGYDAKNRIKAINGDIKSYTVRNNRIYELLINYTTDYLFTDKKDLKVVYNASFDYPAYPDWNTSNGSTGIGTFNENGTLLRFGPFDCEYSGITLTKAYFDNGRVYTLQRDRDNNLSGYLCDSLDNAIVSKLNIYKYSSHLNKTNVDFSALFGNWVVERDIAGNENWLYPRYQLAAFDMLGARSRYLPEGEWTLDDKGCPVKCTLPSGLIVTIEYVE